VKSFLKSIFNLNRLHTIIPVLLLIIYGPGIIMAFYRLGNSLEVLEFLAIFAVSVLSYFGFYYLFKIGIKRRPVFSNGLSVIRLSNFLFLLYSIYIAYVVITAPKIPLFLSLQGANSSEISYYRELFFKARIGVDAILVYLNAIFTVALLPFLIASLYILNYKFRHFYLVFFVFTLLLSMEKSLIIRALLPLFVLILNGFVTDKYITFNRILVSLFVGLFLISFLALGNFASDEAQLLTELAELDPNTAKYFIVSNPDSVGQFMFNRIFWIPYITAIDWLEFFNVVLDRKFVLGSSSSLLSGLFGMERINLERLVFEFEWGQNESGTGSSNAVYFIDIFLNFGWIGVLLSNATLAYVVRFFEMSGNNAAKSSFFVYAYFICTSTLLGVLFSSGLLILMFVIFIVKKV
jgi:hypothetical protein